jgi:hypothetical protein
MTTTTGRSLTAEQAAEFEERGFLRLRGFYPVDLVAEVQAGIHGIIGLVMAEHGLRIERRPFSPDTFDDGFLEMLAIDRSLGGVVYDAVKQLPAFHRLLSCRANEDLVRELRATALAGIAHGSYGIRIDLPGEARFATLWHQDYLSHFRSRDGLVLWAPLVPVTPDLGPVRLVPGSHRLGPLPLAPSDADPADGDRDFQMIAKSLAPVDADRVADELGVVAPESEPGDLLVIDFLTLHESGANTGARARWSMQLRWFNFEHESGRRMGWRGGIATGTTVQDVHPELVLMPEA